ncbi:MAG: autotransporter strand-loop-strand O-heptosyltransferase [Schwartzia sp.]|nr:autotransporter strand-loop-strand O-heptosyltransferase [Schwartzia sp. (in: firmicutes)]
MDNFLYPVQYFFCNTWGMSQADMFGFVIASNSVKVAVGSIMGETGIAGLKIDFNYGLRLQIPSGNWHVIISDYDSGTVFFDQDISEATLISAEKYYIHWQIEIFLDGEPVFGHLFDPVGQKIRIICLSEQIGDTISFLPYIPMARDWYQADVYYYILDRRMKDIGRRLFPDIRMKEEMEEGTYATFYLTPALGGRWGWSPMDGRVIPMTQTGQMILGFPCPAPKISWGQGVRQIKEPYVCIGVQGSSVSKGWLFPGGWDEVTAYLKDMGYRVICIDRDKIFRDGHYVLEMPAGAEDFTGNRSILERADMLHYADFFIGLASGLSWLADIVGCPVVMIGGFSLFWCEFFTPYRVYNRLACNGCYNDLRVDWKANKCVRQSKDSDGYLQCTKKISPRMVIQAIDRLIADKRSGRLKQYLPR